MSTPISAISTSAVRCLTPGIVISRRQADAPVRDVRDELEPRELL
jgi:hypothetical protein